MPQFETYENSNITTLQTAEYFVYMSHYEGPLAILNCNIEYIIQHSTSNTAAQTRKSFNHYFCKKILVQNAYRKL